MANVVPSKALPPEKAYTTGRWAEIMFRALNTRVAKRWRFVSFRGVGGGEYRGIVDVLAIRKHTSQPEDSLLKRGDLFDMVLVQVKGGSAQRPSIEDRQRLSEVADYYNAQEVMLFEWYKGKSCRLFKLGQDLEWEPTTGTEVFG